MAGVKLLKVGVYIFHSILGSVGQRRAADMDVDVLCGVQSWRRRKLVTVV